MDPAPGELKEALISDKLRQKWQAREDEQYRVISEILLKGDNLLVQGLAQMAWDRMVAGGKLNEAKASERGLGDMNLVIATVGSIDPQSVCEDEGCAQRGELYKDHRVSHTAKGKKKFTRGGCPDCGGRLHNKNDAAQLIAFQCLWRQAFGDGAKRTPVTAATLAEVSKLISDRTITHWADRNLLMTVLAAPPKAAPAPPTGSVTSAAVTPPAAPVAPRLAQGNPGEAVVPTGQPTSPAVPTVDPAEAKEKREKKAAALRAALSGARVRP